MRNRRQSAHDWMLAVNQRRVYNDVLTRFAVEGVPFALGLVSRGSSVATRSLIEGEEE